MDGDEETFFQLLDSGDDCNAVEISRNISLDKYTCLHVLCSGSRSGEKYLRLLRRLLKSPGILLNPVNSMGDTPLITASYYVELLLKAAEESRDPSLLRAMLDHASVGNRQPNLTALQWASQRRHVEVVQQLLRAGATVPNRPKGWSYGTCPRILTLLNAASKRPGQVAVKSAPSVEGKGIAGRISGLPRRSRQRQRGRHLSAGGSNSNSKSNSGGAGAAGGRKRPRDSNREARESILDDSRGEGSKDDDEERPKKPAARTKPNEQNSNSHGALAALSAQERLQLAKLEQADMIKNCLRPHLIFAPVEPVEGENMAGGQWQPDLREVSMDALQQLLNCALCDWPAPSPAEGGPFSVVTLRLRKQALEQQQQREEQERDNKEGQKPPHRRKVAGAQGAREDGRAKMAASEDFAGLLLSCRALVTGLLLPLMLKQDELERSDRRTTIWPYPVPATNRPALAAAPLPDALVKLDARWVAQRKEMVKKLNNFYIAYSDNAAQQQSDQQQASSSSSSPHSSASPRGSLAASVSSLASSFGEARARLDCLQRIALLEGEMEGLRGAFAEDWKKASQAQARARAPRRNQPAPPEPLGEEGQGDCPPSSKSSLLALLVSLQEHLHGQLQTVQEVAQAFVDARPPSGLGADSDASLLARLALAFFPGSAGRNLAPSAKRRVLQEGARRWMPGAALSASSAPFTAPTPSASQDESLADLNYPPATPCASTVSSFFALSLSNAAASPLKKRHSIGLRLCDRLPPPTLLTASAPGPTLLTEEVQGDMLGAKTAEVEEVRCSLLSPSLLTPPPRAASFTLAANGTEFKNFDSPAATPAEPIPATEAQHGFFS